MTTSNGVKPIFLGEGLPPMFFGDNAVSPSPDVALMLAEDDMDDLLMMPKEEREPYAFVQGVASRYYLYPGANHSAVVLVFADGPSMEKRPVCVWKRGTYPENYRDALTWMQNHAVKDLEIEFKD